MLHGFIVNHTRYSVKGFLYFRLDARIKMADGDDVSLDALLGVDCSVSTGTLELPESKNGANDAFSEVSKSSDNLDSLTEETHLLHGSSQETIPATSLLSEGNDVENENDGSNDVEDPSGQDQEGGEDVWRKMSQEEKEAEKQKKNAACQQSKQGPNCSDTTQPGARPKRTAKVDQQVTIGGCEVKFLDACQPVHKSGVCDSTGATLTDQTAPIANEEHDEVGVLNGGPYQSAGHAGCHKSNKDEHQVTIGESRVTIVESKTPYVDIPSDFDQMSHSSSVAGSLSKGIVPSSVFIGMEECRKLPNLPKRPPLLLEFQNLSYSVREGSFWKKNRGMKTILKDLSGKFLPGELIAIMGPSGAGKSSLMNVLAGYKTGSMKGKLLVNGQDRDLGLFRKLSCYIMQDSHLLPQLTVMEAMMISANLKLPRTTNYKEKKLLVEEILSLLGLSDCSQTQTYNISGGQSKRLAIAQELVSNPPMLFFDEPTSGLDSSSSFQCLSLLKSLARGGRTVICTIHQPSARLFEMFDKLYILGDGECIYQGSVAGLVPYLKSMNYICPPYHNPADFVIELACGEYGDVLPQLTKSYREGKCEEYSRLQSDFNSLSSSHSLSIALGDFPATSSNGHSPSATFRNGASMAVTVYSDGSGKSQTVVKNENWVHDTRFAANLLVQFWILFKRAFIVFFRDQTLTHIRFSAPIFIGILIGLLYLKIGDDASKAFNNAGFLFLCLMFLMFAAMMPTVLSFPLEMNVLVREHINYWYSLKAYYLAKTMSDFPFQVAIPVVYCTIAYWMTGQPPEANRFLIFIGISIITAMISQSVGLLIGAATSMEVAVFLGPITSLPLLLFSGFFVTLPTMPWYLRWISYVSFVRYSFEGVMVTIYGLERGQLNCPEGEVCIFQTGQDVLDNLDMDKDRLGIDIAILAGFFIITRVVCYFLLRWKVKSHI